MEEQRVVRTRAPAGEGQWVFGSGYLIAAERVLTARHVLAPEGAEAVVGRECEVRVFPFGSAQGWLPGRVLWLHPAADAAVLAVSGLGAGLVPVRWGRVEGSEPLHWTATGFPVASLDDEDRREEEAFGRLAPGSAASTGGLALTVESREAEPGAEGQSGWAGLSGAAVFSGDLLVGMVTADPGRWARSLDGVRSSRLLEDPMLPICSGTSGEMSPATTRGRLQEHVRPGGEPSSPGGRRVIGDRVSTGVDNWRDRDELRAALRTALVGGPEARRILSVTGRRGIGKSATVDKVVAEFERPDPSRSPLEDLDGIVYLSTRTGVGSLTLARTFEALTRLLPEPLDDRLKRDWDKLRSQALPSLWEALKDRRCVLVLDNLDDLQDPDTGVLRDPDLSGLLDSVCHTPYPQRVVTTSQQPLSLPAEQSPFVKEFRMEDGLGGKDAVVLLRAIYTGDVPLDQFDDQELERATQRLFGIPRGIELLADLLKHNPLDLPDLLESDATLDILVEHLVSRAFLALDVTERRVVELLALAEVPLPEREVATILTDLVDPGAVRAALSALVRSRQVGFDVRARTVRLHPLDADWVRNRLIEADSGMRVDLDRRLARWYAARRTPTDSWRALADAVPSRLEFRHRWRSGDRTEAMAVLAEAANFLARKGESATLARAIAVAETALPDGVGRLYLERCRFAVEFFSGSLVRAEAALRAGRAAASSAGLSAVVDELDVELGTVQRHRGDCAGAADTLQTLLRRDSGSLAHDLRLEALLELGLVLCYLRDWAGAETVANEMEGLIRPSDLRKILAGPFDIRALARFGAGNLEGALEAADRAIDLYTDSPNEDNAGYLYNVRGLVWLERGDLGRAEEETRRGVELAADFRIDRLQGICATNLAWVLLRAARWEEARNSARLAADRLSSTGIGAAETPVIIAEVLGRPEKHPDVEADLRIAAERSFSNSDFYTPSPTILHEIAVVLQGRATE